MNGIGIILSAIIGLFAGSAIWVVARNQASRLPLLQSLDCAGGPAPVAWLPFSGFGFARNCEDHKPVWYRPVFEIAVAAYFGVAAAAMDDRLHLVAVFIFSLPLLTILLVDAWTRLVHTNVIGIGVVAGLLIAAIESWHALIWAVLGMLVAVLIFGGIFVIAALVYRNVKVVPFGLGDVYLAGMIGVMVGASDVLRALLTGIFLGGIILALLLATKRVGRRQAVAYGPFLCLGALVTLVLR